MSSVSLKKHSDSVIINHFSISIVEYVGLWNSSMFVFLWYAIVLLSCFSCWKVLFKKLVVMGELILKALLSEKAVQLI